MSNVESWHPPTAILLIANNRVKPIVKTWILKQLHQIEDEKYNLILLAASCYMQGMNDAFDTLRFTHETHPDNGL
jgi:hypothetical protein